MSICEDGRCGACALCTSVDLPPSPGALERVRLAVDLEEPALTSSRRALFVSLGVAAVSAGVFLAGHGVSHAAWESLVVVAAVAVGVGASWFAASARWVLLAAPLALLVSIAGGSLAPGSVGCLVTALALAVPGALVSWRAVRRGASLSGWVLGSMGALALTTAAVHFGCPNYSGAAHVILFHVLGPIALAALAPALARRIASSVDRRISAA